MKSLIVLLLTLAFVSKPVRAMAEEAAKKGYIGLFCKNVYDSAEKKKLSADAHLKSNDYVCVVSMVDVGSPAEQSDIRAGDQVIMVNGKTFTSNGDVDLQLKNLAPGSTAVLSLANGKKKNVPVKPRPGNWSQLPKNNKIRGAAVTDAFGMTAADKKATDQALKQYDAESDNETSGVKSIIRIKMATKAECKDYHFVGKCQAGILDFIQPKCKSHDQGFSTGINLIQEIDGQQVTSPDVFYAGLAKKGPRSLKVYWYESDPESDAFKNGTKTVQFDLTKCK
ncbi:MAG: PDZ domain-containing protein [Bdellovibrionaceae bacterium]|nr:PDZ domain-containing protein [Pseudobdellovibrionaceae bacterium]